MATALVLLLAGCSGSGSQSSPKASPTTLLLTVNEVLIRDDIGGVQPRDVFLEVHYKFINKSDTDIVLVQDDLALIDGNGAIHAYSPGGLEAWFATRPGYQLTDHLLVRRGELTKQWVSVFDVVESDLGDDLKLQFRDEAPVTIFVPVVR